MKNRSNRAGMLFFVYLISVPVWAGATGLGDIASTPGTAQWQRIMALVDAGQAEQALAQLDVLAEADPDNFDTRWLRGFTLLRLQRNAEAIDALEPVVQRLKGAGTGYGEVVRGVSLELADAYFLHGRALKKSEHYQEALRRFEQALAIDRRYRLIDAAAGLGHIGDIYHALERLPEAASAYREVLGLKAAQSSDGDEGLAMTFYKLADVCWAMGERTEARMSLRRSLAILEVLYGSEHQLVHEVRKALATVEQAIVPLPPDAGMPFGGDPVVASVIDQLRLGGGQEPIVEEVVAALNRKVVRMYREGDYGQGVKVAESALTFATRTLGKDHRSTLMSINNLATLYKELGRYGDAERLYTEVLKALDRGLGKDHPQTLLSVNNLGGLYESMGRYGDAELLYLRVRETRERDLGKNHPDTLVSVNNLAVLYMKQGRYRESEPLHLRVLETRERVLRKDHPHTLTSVHNLAAVFERQGRYEAAQRFFLRALAARERELGEDHPDTLMSISTLAGLYDRQGRYGEAESLFLRALEGSERELGKDHPDTMMRLNGLAGVYKGQGRYGEAEQLYLSAVKANGRVRGKEHPDTLISANGLAGVYYSQVRYEKAEQLYLWVLDARERELGRDHHDTLGSINDLALLYQQQGRYEEAESLYLEVLGTAERTLGKDHPSTLVCVNNLATLYLSQGWYGEAETLFLRELKASERELGKDHPSTLVSINNLASLYQLGGRYEDAESLYLRALNANTGAMGDNHPNTLLMRQNLTLLYLHQGCLDSVLEQLRLIEAGLRHWVEGELANTLSEPARRQLLQTQALFQSIVFNLALRWPSPQHRDYAADVLLRWKAVGLEQEARAARMARIAPDSEAQERIRELSAARAEMSFVVNQAAQAPAAKQRKQTRVAELSARIDVLERQFRREAGTGNAAQTALDVSAAGLGAALPARSALVELRLFKRMNFETLEGGETHVLALLLPSITSAIGAETAEPRLRDLGPWQALAPKQQIADAEVGVFRTKFARPRSKSSGLYRALFGPWDQVLAAYQTLFIAPDGRLQLTAFSALKLADGRYWVERQSLRRVTTGRDLLLTRTAEGQGLWAIGGADYQSYPGVAVPAHPQVAEKTPDPASSADLSGAKTPPRAQRGGFKPLPGTAPEARSVACDYHKSRSDETHLLLGHEASESAIKALHAPRVLHLATHGFYLDAQKGETPRPLTRAGLAFAGANLAGNGPDGEDGILYALEVLGLDLQGTELVTLSACDTGQGELDSSEGVYGLTRAFRIAGARHVLMTLWPLNDDLARAFMSDFYQDWLSHPGEHPSKALHRTQLAFINSTDTKRRQPQYWAPYVLVESGIDAGFERDSSR